MALTVEIEKRLGSFRLHVSFAAASGEPLALLGASGCGKSLALRCIAGLERPDRGRIQLNGRVLFDSGKKIDLPPQARRVGYLFQQYALFPHMTVAENIAAGARRLEKSRRAARAAELTAALRLEGLGNLRPRQLSGGQQQRAALARLLASEPEALLLDEPLAALDSHLRWQLEPTLREAIGRFGGPAVWVSHDQGEVCRNCRRVCFLEEGRSAPVRGMRELLADPGTMGAARLSGCRNCLPAEPGPEPGSVRVPAWGLTLRAAAPWRPGLAAVGIRARQVRPAGAETPGAFPCAVLSAAEDVSSVLAALRPLAAEEGAPPLWMELEPSAWLPLADRRQLWVSVEPEQVLLLEP